MKNKSCSITFCEVPLHCETKPFRRQIWMQKLAQNEVSNIKNFFSSKMFPIHRSWSRVVPKHLPGPRQSFSTILHPQNKFQNFLKSRNFDHRIHFWKVGCLMSLKNAFGRSTKKLTCFSILLFRSNVTRGAKYGTISNFLSYGFAIQGLLLKKFHFLTSSCEQTFKNMLKMLEKCLKKMSKKSKKFFLPKCSQSIVVGPEWSQSTPRVPGNRFRPSYTPRTTFKIFLKSRNFDHKIHFWKVGCLTSLKNAFGRSTKKLTCFSILLFRSNVTRGAKYGTISNLL